MMAAVGAARHDVLKPFPEAASFRDRLDQFADAMHDEGDLRAVPAAARRSRRPAKTTYVFSCFNQDQPLDSVDWSALDQRLRQNSRAGKAHRRMDRPLPRLVASGSRQMQRI